MHHPICEGRGGDFPALRLMDGEGVVAARHPGAVTEFLVQPLQMAFLMQPKLLYIGLPALAPPRFLCRKPQIFHAGDIGQGEA